MRKTGYSVEDFYAFKIKNIGSYFMGQHFSFKMICCYLFVEFVRPQSIIPALDFLPWAMLFILLSAVGAVLDKSIKWTSSPSNVLIVFFALFIGMATYITPLYPEVSKKYFMDFFNWVIIYFLVINIVNTKERFYIFLLIFLLAAAKIAIGTSKSWIFRGFSFTSWGLMGPRGFFQNSGELAILMLVLFPLAFYLYQSLKNRIGRWERYLLIICCVCPILTILGASSRGAQIALIIQLAFMFRKSIFKIKPLIGVILLCATIFYLLPQEQKERFSQTGDDKTSQQRLLYWKHGWDMMKEHPLTGVGFFNFIPYYENHFLQDMLYEHAQLPHNIFIQVGTDAGFIALVFFIWIICYCLFVTYSMSKNKNNDPVIRACAAGLGLGVLGFLVAGQFVTVSYYPFLWINFSLIVALKVVVLKTAMNFVPKNI
jgi:putative inorganic carbon (hco3(-)) transporter